VRSFEFGDVRATYAVDGTIRLNAGKFFPDINEPQWSPWPGLLDGEGYITMSTGGLLVERDGAALLIDAGVGADDPGFKFGTVNTGAMVDVLAALGKPVSQIDVVAFTHLHFDHVGWAVTGDTAAKTFGSARYRASAREQDYWKVHSAALDALTANIEPFEDGDEVFPGVRAVVGPGHTPGHASYVVTSDTGVRLVVFGDAFHTPAQITQPTWLSVAEYDGAALVATRHALLAELTAADTFGFGFHFGDQAFGRVRVDDGTARWQAVPTVVRAPEPPPG
jgi:glyoxylase-like metal-dependent hydrolase (beta-lactamase superfamily II)